MAPLLGHVIAYLWLLMLMMSSVVCGDINELQLDSNYLMRWSVTDNADTLADITFELHVRTTGLVLFGISSSGQIHNADIVAAWVQNGQARLQDRHGIRNTGSGDTSLDMHPDYDLISAHENTTHTVVKFRRKLFTCDPQDVNITSATQWVHYAYRRTDPDPEAEVSFRNHPHGSRPVYLLNRPTDPEAFPPDVKIWDLRNVDVSLPESEDTVYWCRIFKLPPLERKHHMIRFEPIFKPGNEGFIHHMNIYECEGDPGVFEVLAATEGTRCYQSSMPPLFFNCNNVVVSWTSKSHGFTYPKEAGYPLHRGGGAKYFMLETHYDNPNLLSGIVDNSGLRLYYTSHLRHHDAGVLSVGIDPNWKHIVPPGHERVISEAHCVSDCTQQALPSRGINVFAVHLHTHWLGKQVQLRHIRGDVELSPIVNDPNYDVHFQDYKHLRKPVNILPGDHLISQCSYNSESRNTITLGGLSTREETCLAYLIYYPRIDLSLCYSLPSLATILHSLGIQELYPGSDPVRIKHPVELANQTVEERLISFDWERNFDKFQEATRTGSYKPLCWAKAHAIIDGSSTVDYYPPNITLPYAEPNHCVPHHKVPKTPHRKNLSPNRSRNRSTSPTGSSSTPQPTSPASQDPPTTLTTNQGRGHWINRSRLDETTEISEILLVTASTSTSHVTASGSGPTSGSALLLCCALTLCVLIFDILNAAEPQ